MKRYMRLVPILVILCLLAGCGAVSSASKRSSITTTLDSSAGSSSIANYWPGEEDFRVWGNDPHAKYPQTVKITSETELESYYQKYKDIYHLDQNTTGKNSLCITNPPTGVSSIGTAIFNNANYNSDFFKTKYLLLILLSSDNGNTYYSTSTNMPVGNKLDIRICSGTLQVTYTKETDIKWLLVLKLDNSTRGLAPSLNFSGDIRSIMEGGAPKTFTMQKFETDAIDQKYIPIAITDVTVRSVGELAAYRKKLLGKYQINEQIAGSSDDTMDQSIFSNKIFDTSFFKQKVLMILSGSGRGANNCLAFAKNDEMHILFAYWSFSSLPTSKRAVFQEVLIFNASDLPPERNVVVDYYNTMEYQNVLGNVSDYMPSVPSFSEVSS